MRYLKILLLSFVVIGLMVGPASAGTLALTADQQTTAASLNQTAIDPTYYPAEAVVPSTIKILFTTGVVDATMPGAVALVGGAVPKSITYSSTTNLPSGTRIVFTIANGKWLTTAAYYLIKDEGPADFDGVTVASADSVTATVLTFIVGSTPIDAGTVMILSTSQDIANAGTRTAVVNPVITMDAGLATAGTRVTVAVTECYDSVGPIAGGIASAIPIVGSYQQFAWTRVAGAGTINVQSPDLRRTFLASALSPATPGTLKLADNQAPGDVDTGLAGNQVANFAVTLFTAALATYDYVITGAQLNKLAAVNGLVLDMDNGNANDKAFTIVSDTSATLSIATNDNVGWYSAVAEDVDFTVTGAVTLDVQTFTVVALLNFADNTKYNDVALASGNIMVWTINGYQAVVPYITTNPLYQTICIANNSSVSAADVVVDILSSETGAVTSNLGVGTIAAKSTGRLNFAGQTVSNAAGGSAPIPLGTEERYSARLTITADQNQVYVNCIQTDPAGSKRMVPVLTLEGAINWRN
jgi:hypothetical protein